jgi:hypothetical protein
MNGSATRRSNTSQLTPAEFFWRALILVSVALIPVLIWFLFDVILIVVGAILIAGVRGTTENGRKDAMFLCAEKWGMAVAEPEGTAAD